MSNTVKEVQANAVNDSSVTSNNSCNATDGLNITNKEQTNDAHNNLASMKGIEFCDSGHLKRYRYCL